MSARRQSSVPSGRPGLQQWSSATTKNNNKWSGVGVHKFTHMARQLASHDWSVKTPRNPERTQTSLKSLSLPQAAAKRLVHASGQTSVLQQFLRVMFVCFGVWGLEGQEDQRCPGAACVSVDPVRTVTHGGVSQCRPHFPHSSLSLVPRLSLSTTRWTLMVFRSSAWGRWGWVLEREGERETDGGDVPASQSKRRQWVGETEWEGDGKKKSG